MKVYCQNVWNYNPSEYRNSLINELVKEFGADVCMFQECGHKTNRVGKKPIQELISDVYTEVPTPVKEKNYTPVFYKTEKFNLIDRGYFLYSGLNDEDSKSVTWAVLEDKATKKRIAVASTHFWWMFESEKDNLQRLENASELKKCCESIVAKHNVSVIVGGDFNNGINSKQGVMPYNKMIEAGFKDIRNIAEETTDLFTHHEYPVLTDDERYVDGAMPTKNLDYIFTFGENAPKALKFEIMTTQKALDSSDHCPLLGVFDF